MQEQEQDMSRLRSCWCGNAELEPFGPQYGACRACGTLVSQAGLGDEELVVSDDETDFYGKQYWHGHQQDDLGFPDLGARSRKDPTERNLHWLRTLLKYRPAPAATMELGCAHGSFVALMSQSGFDARGVEMSPWVVDYGRRTFGARIDVGPVEALEIAPASLDVIALMDVLEHLPDPVATMRHCLGLLRPDGLLLIQTPCWDEAVGHDAMVASDSPFLEQLKADEHLYLLSRRAVTELFRCLGAGHLQFEPAIFVRYDMFLAVGREPLRTHDREAGERALHAAPNGWMVQALLDLRERETALEARLAECEADRAARGGQVDTLTRMLRESEADRAARGGQIETLTRIFRESEADRAARGGQIETLTRILRESEADRAARGDQIDTLTRMVHEANAAVAAAAAAQNPGTKP
jgi:SAM-dependent methyltransferase